MQQLKCKNCGSPMHLLPGGTSAKCPVCGTEAVVTTARAVNAAIAAKGDIGGVMEYRLDGRQINDALCGLFHKRISTVNPSIFKDIRILKVEKCCASAFLFECDWQANYACEVAAEKILTKVQSSFFDKDCIETKEVTRTEWQPQTGAVSGSCSILVCSSQEIADGMNVIWSGLNVDLCDLVDIESAEFPAELRSFRETLTPSAAFDKYGKSQIDIAVKQAIQKQFSGRYCRNFNLGNPMVRKNASRVLLTCARVFADYKGKQLEFWIGNNRVFTFQPEMLEDQERAEKWEELLANCEAAKKKMPGTGCGCLCTIVLAGAMFALWSSGIAENVLEGRSPEGLLVAAGIVLLLVFGVVSGIVENRKEADTKKAENEVDEFKKEMEEAWEQSRKAEEWLSGLGPGEQVS